MPSERVLDGSQDSSKQAQIQTKFELCRAEEFSTVVKTRIAIAALPSPFSSAEEARGSSQGNKEKTRLKNNLKINYIMNKKNIWEVILKVIVAAVTAALTAITTTSCIGHGPL